LARAVLYENMDQSSPVSLSLPCLPLSPSLPLPSLSLSLHSFPPSLSLSLPPSPYHSLSPSLLLPHHSLSLSLSLYLSHVLYPFLPSVRQGVLLVAGVVVSVSLLAAALMTIVVICKRR